jgi:dolichyl-phosphate beta-glucosyltransferase
VRVGEPWHRHVVGRVFNVLVQMLAVPGIQDTQCGFKMFSAEAAEALFGCSRLDGLAFDVEVLFLARRAGLSVPEVGIEWHARRDSRVNVRLGVTAFADIVRVRWHAAIGRYPVLAFNPVAPPTGAECLPNPGGLRV